MPQPDERTTEEEASWDDRFSKLALMDGDGWDAEHERLKAEWMEVYVKAFVDIAVSRRWKRENAETWPSEIQDEAFIETYRYAYDPRRSAEVDVIACEEPL